MAANGHHNLSHATLRYPELASLRHEVRLLELQPARNPSDPVVARLVKAKITPETEYIGLSSLHGPANEIAAVYIDGQRLYISATIAEALRNLRTVFLPERPPSVEDLQPPTPTSSSSLSTMTTTEKEKDAVRVAQPAKKAPKWLRELMRGVRSILPESRTASSRRAHDMPLRVWTESLCVNRRSAREEGQFRSHMALAYRSAQMVVGWLGPRSDNSDLAVEAIRAWDEALPREFGDPGDRQLHPENYAPHMAWMAPVAHYVMFEGEVTTPHDIPAFGAIADMLNRPFFQRSWLVDEMASARFPAFLLGDEIISWSQLLRLNLVNEEIKTHGADHFPEDLRKMLDYMPFDTVYSFLRDHEARQKLGTIDAVDAVASRPRGFGITSRGSSQSNLAQP